MQNLDPVNVACDLDVILDEINEPCLPPTVKIVCMQQWITPTRKQGSNG